ncbi:cytochrome P450 3A21-like [Littorina saxatilis]
MVVETFLSWALPLTLCVVALLLLWVYGNWPYNTWSQLGIPGPKPVPFLGNVGDLKEKGAFDATLGWCKKYGKVFGVYLMRDPVLFTTDLDILKEVFIKDFNNFSTRGLIPRLVRYPVKASLVFVNGDTWRRQRHTLSPTFSASKLKLMSGFISRCCENLLDAIHTLTVEGKALDVKKIFGAYTLDVVAGTGFGFETNSLKEVDNVFLQNVSRLLASSTSLSLSAFIAGIFPALAPLVLALGIRQASKKEAAFVEQTIRALIEERKKEKSKGRVDLLQLLLEAEASEAEVKANPQDNRLTTSEIVAEGVLFFLAAYDTTATTLQYLAYLLALHPEKQEKLYRHILEAVGDAEPSYDTVSSIPYLDCCIHEALRVLPTVALTGRKTLETRCINGVTIPAGCAVMVPIYGLMRDEDIFPDADKFIPERFADEAHPIPSLVKDMNFGAGPRQCIGMRLALYEVKMAMVTLLTKVKFTKIPETPDTVKMQPGKSISTPTTPILIGTELRGK